jgi:hypothetical protein
MDTFFDKLETWACNSIGFIVPAGFLAVYFYLSGDLPSVWP